jgi:hypothetical protein
LSVVAVVCGAATVAACAGSADTAGRAAGAAGATEAPGAAEAIQTGGPVRDVDLDFEHQAADIGAIIPGTTNQGAARVRVAIAFAGGGRAILAEGVDGGYGLRFPAHDAGEPAPAAAVVLRSLDTPDPLSPGRLDFRFGADFALDPVSDGGPHDNGDNLVQRGLSADASQYKIQVDHGVPSCRVASPDGVAFVKSDVTAVPERWYRVRCLRRADRVSLSVAPWSGKRWGTPRVSAVSVPTGSVAFDSPGAPFVIGAKVDDEGELIASETDQFNGVVDNVFFEVVP